MRTGKYKVLIFAAFLFIALNYSEVNANTEIILVKSSQQHKDTKIQDIQTMNELNETVKDMKYQLLCAQNEITKLQEMNQNLTRALSENEVKLQMIEKQKLSLEQDIAGRDKQLEELAKQTSLKLNASDNEITELKNQLISSNNELSKLKQEYLSSNNKDSQVKLFQNHLVSYEKQIQDLSEKIIVLNNELAKAKEVSMMANKRANDISGEKAVQINELKNQLLSLNSELNKVRQQYSSVNLKTDNIVNDKDSQISLLQNQLAFSEKQMQDLSYKITALNSDLKKTKEIYDLAIGRQKALENLITLANKRADDISGKKTARINELKKELALYKNTNAAVQTTKMNDNYQKTVAVIGSNIVDSTKSAEDYFNIAKAYQGAKDYKQAVDNYKHAITLNTSFGSAYKELGLIYAQMGDYKNAGNSLKKCLYYSNNPKEQEILRNFISNIEKCVIYK
ncbi:MAG: hypothetical protein PHC34_11960 [Candidatus Gastranaerophilales bacterium]|nr:hypothetical protein [Candidatus Gastranaerophilales bacterium]